VNVGRADLRPERAWSGEIGLDLVSGKGSFTAFVRRSEDLIDWARPSEVDSGGGQPPIPWETRNVEEATFKGIEAESAGAGPFGTRWNLSGMWLSVTSEEMTGFTSKYSLKPLVEQVTAGLFRSVGDFASIGVKFQKARRRGSGSYSLLDARSGFRVGSAWLYLDLTNALNERYPDITGAMAPGRGIYLGLEIGSPQVRQYR
jgi:outer membrane cobalamin receptor